MNLGHIDLITNGLTEAELPGEVNAGARELPMIKVVDRLQVIAQN